MKMSRESRKITDALVNLASKYNIVQGDISPAHNYISDAIIINYFSAPIISVMKAQIQRTKNKEWKHFTMDYWYKYATNVANKTPSMHRNGGYKADISVPSESILESFVALSEFVLTDYSIDDAILINKMVNTNTLHDIMSACNIAKSNGVCEPRYVYAVIEKENAKQLIAEQRMDKIHDKVQSSDKLLGRDIHRHTVIDIATMQYDWEEKKIDMELEAKFNKILKENR